MLSSLVVQGANQRRLFENLSCERAGGARHGQQHAIASSANAAAADVKDCEVCDRMNVQGCRML